MNRLRALRLVDAVVLTTVPLLVGVYLVWSAAEAFRRDIQFDDWWSARSSVASRFDARVRAFRNLPQLLRVERRLDAGQKDAGIVRLNLPSDDWTRMWTDPQLGWGVWTDAELARDGSTLPVKLRKRGDNSVHWSTDKHTITVRTPREEFFKRYRAFGLSVKDPLQAFLANRLAGEFGLLAPSTTVVPVFLNNRFSGLYRFIEPVDESFLRPFDRMPGNIFRGDAAERSDYFKGLPRDVFQNPYIWNRVAMNDRPTGPGTSQLARFLADVNGSTFERHLSLMHRLDRAELTRLLAYLLLTGDPYHMDAVHNQMWYEDPSTGMLHPIPWDTRLLRLSRQDQRLSPVFRALLRDPFLVDGILHEVRQRLDGGFLATADSLLRAVVTRYPDAIAYDQLRTGLVPDPGDPDAAIGVLQANATELRRWLDQAEVAVAAGRAEGLTVLDLDLRGYVGVDLTALALPGTATTPALFLDRNRNGALDPGDPAVRGTFRAGVFTPAAPVALLPGWRTDTLGVRPGRLAYRLFVRGAAGAVRPVLTNRVTGAAVEPGPWTGGEAIPATRSYSPWAFPVPGHTVHRWSGTVRLTESVRIPEGDTLIVAAGTTLRLAPDVNVVSRGPILMQGTRERPITVIPDVPGRPWGAFSALRHGADGTTVTWTRFYYGGGGFLDGVEYIGMVNLHRVNRALFRHVTFEQNVRSDDTFHALHSQITLDSSEFINANSDAVDLDISTGVIAHNRFRNSGGDAIDLMTSTPLVYGNHIVASGDKGVSIGEASSPLVFNNYIEGGKRGVEVKDRSTPLVLNNHLVRNGVGIYQDRKNWRYGGGAWATVANNLFEGNTLGIQSDAFSRLTLADNPGIDSAVGAGAAWVARPAAIAPPREQLGWLYGLYGIPALADTAGPVPGLEPRHQPDLVEWQEFEDDFGAYTDGWTAAENIVRLTKRRSTLVLSVEARPGAITRAVDWTVPPGEEWMVVAEASTAELTGAALEVQGAAGTLARPLELTGDPLLFRLTGIRLPPGHYTGLRLRAAPSARVEKVATKTGWIDLKPSELYLRGWRLVRLPAAPVSTALAAPSPEHP
ncbi:MAG: right-handed parallel beta-helix repeat-containing protein [Gemmatimonadetes bacterium]|nr:right-handed parallel beta-helix repeat-containing protein [Gemmatimonadota bacterium]